jgi:hypothetical protein
MFVIRNKHERIGRALKIRLFACMNKIPFKIELL